MSDLRVPDLNQVIIAGRLTRDPELKYTASGLALCKIAIANTRYFKRKDGERGEETTFVDATLWDKQAEWVGERLRWNKIQFNFQKKNQMERNKFFDGRIRLNTPFCFVSFRPMFKIRIGVFF